MIFLKERQKFCRIRFIFSIFYFIFIFSENSVAISTSTLPEHIYNPSFRYGHIEGLDQRFTDTGTLVKLTDLKSIEFDAKNLSKFNSQAQSLIASLNRFGAFGIGDSLNLGTLAIETKPTIDYSAPILAVGVTEHWTVGVGLPVIHYQNSVKLSQSFSNINYYRSQFSGLSGELDQALNTNIGEATQQTLVSKGYRRLDHRDEKFLADIQLLSLFKIYEDSNLSLLHQATLTLPTGPRYDPNDLLALNTFHKTCLENQIGISQKIGNSWKMTPYTSFKFYLPEKIEARVPSSEDDILPDQSSLENIEKQEGLSAEVGLLNAVDLTDSFQVAFDYHLGSKTEDRYTGQQNSRYDLLSKNSASRWQKASVEFIYSSVKSYLQKNSKIPLMLSLNLFDTFAGQNIERRQGQELSVSLFF